MIFEYYININHDIKSIYLQAIPIETKICQYTHE
jgi:hypothetical protein